MRKTRERRAVEGLATTVLRYPHPTWFDEGGGKRPPLLPLRNEVLEQRLDRLDHLIRLKVCDWAGEGDQRGINLIRSAQLRLPCL